MAETPTGLDWKAFTPDDSPKTPMDLWSDPRLKELSTPDLTIGDVAFDFELPVYDYSDYTNYTDHTGHGDRTDHTDYPEGIGRETNETFHLASEARERPVALVFGSYT